jgi:hypothetical protein
MTEVSGQPIVNKSDSVIASYLKPQDYFMNPPQGTSTAFTFPNLTLNDRSPILTSGVTPINATINITTGFSTSGRPNPTATALGSGPFSPLGYFTINVSGNAVMVPYFAP